MSLEERGHEVLATSNTISYNTKWIHGYTSNGNDNDSVRECQQEAKIYLS